MILSLEKRWVTPHPWHTALNVSSLDDIGVLTPTTYGRKASSLKYGCARTHDVQPGILQLCYLFTFYQQKHAVISEHMWWSLVDKIMKFDGGGMRFEQVMDMFSNVCVIFHLLCLLKVKVASVHAAFCTRLHGNFNGRTPHWGTTYTEIRAPSIKNQSCQKVPSLKHGVDQNGALHAMPIARNSTFLASAFAGHSTLFLPNYLQI